MRPQPENQHRLKGCATRREDQNCLKGFAMRPGRELVDGYSMKLCLKNRRCRQRFGICNML
jgi:hypothetical protein